MQESYISCCWTGAKVVKQIAKRLTLALIIPGSVKPVLDPKCKKILQPHRVVFLPCIHRQESKHNTKIKPHQTNPLEKTPNPKEKEQKWMWDWKVQNKYKISSTYNIIGSWACRTSHSPANGYRCSFPPVLSQGIFYCWILHMPYYIQCNACRNSPI